MTYLESGSMDGESARGVLALENGVNDGDVGVASVVQRESAGEAGWASADDEDVGVLSRMCFGLEERDHSADSASIYTDAYGCEATQRLIEGAAARDPCKDRLRWRDSVRPPRVASLALSDLSLFSHRSLLTR